MRCLVGNHKSGVALVSSVNRNHAEIEELTQNSIGGVNVVNWENIQ